MNFLLSLCTCCFSNELAEERFFVYGEQVWWGATELGIGSVQIIQSGANAIFLIKPYSFQPFRVDRMNPRSFLFIVEVYIVHYWQTRAVTSSASRGPQCRY